MAQAQKYFFCYGNDRTSADQAIDQRLYTYASFLLTYDPNTSVLWEYYRTPSGGHVMPESRLVPMDPDVGNLTSADELRTVGGAYMRAYRQCYIAGAPAGPCIVAVNPDADAPHSVNFHGFQRTLSMQGSGVFDGGTIRIDSVAPPAELAPLQAVIAFK